MDLLGTIEYVPQLDSGTHLKIIKYVHVNMNWFRKCVSYLAWLLCEPAHMEKKVCMPGGISDQRAH